MARDIALQADRNGRREQELVLAKIDAIEGRARLAIEQAKRPPTPPMQGLDEARARVAQDRAVSDARWREMLEADRRVEDIDRAKPQGFWAAITGKTRKHAQEAAQAAQERDNAHQQHQDAVGVTRASVAVLERSERGWNAAAKVLADQAEKDAQKARQELAWARVAKRCLTDDPALARDPAKLDEAIRERIEQERAERIRERQEEIERQRHHQLTRGPRMR